MDHDPVNLVDLVQGKVVNFHTKNLSVLNQIGQMKIRKSSRKDSPAAKRHKTGKKRRSLEETFEKMQNIISKKGFVDAEAMEKIEFGRTSPKKHSGGGNRLPVMCSIKEVGFNLMNPCRIVTTPQI